MQGPKVIVLTVALSLVVACWGKLPNHVSPCVFCSTNGKIQCGKSLRSQCEGARHCTTEQYKACLQNSAYSEVCDDVGYYPLSGSNTRYYKCVINEQTGALDKVIEECPANTHYVSLIQRCMADHELDAMKKLWAHKNLIGPYVCQKPGVFADFRNCKNYHTCKIGASKGEKGVCPVGQFFNENDGRCTNYLSVSCAEKLTRKYYLDRVLSEARYWEILQYMLNEPYHESEPQVTRGEDHPESEIELPSEDVLNRVLFGSERKDVPVGRLGALGNKDTDAQDRKQKEKSRNLNRGDNNDDDDDDDNYDADYDDDDDDDDDDTRRNKNNSNKYNPDTNIFPMRYESKSNSLHFERPLEVNRGLTRKTQPEVLSVQHAQPKESSKTNPKENKKMCSLPCDATPLGRQPHPDVHRGFACQAEGHYRDVLNCHMFYKCIPGFKQGNQWKIEHVSCGVRYYNPKTGTCDENKPPGCTS